MKMMRAFRLGIVSIAEGMASVLTWGAYEPERPYIDPLRGKESPLIRRARDMRERANTRTGNSTSDWMNLRSDWEKVGGDFRGAIEKAREEIKRRIE